MSGFGRIRIAGLQDGQGRSQLARQPCASGAFNLLDSVDGPCKKMVASRDIARGTRILEESPIIRGVFNTNDRSKNESSIRRQVDMLTAEQRRKYLSLRNARNNNLCEPVVGIALTNCLPFDIGTGEVGVFLQASCISHACRPNAYRRWNDEIARVTIHTTRDVRAGETLTADYINSAAPYAMRQQMLSQLYNIECRCELCSKPTNERRSSDERLILIAEYSGHFFEPETSTTSLTVGLNYAYMTQYMTREEGLGVAATTTQYLRCADLAAWHGDEARASVFAETARRAGKIFLGKDTGFAVYTTQMAQNPRISGKWRPGVCQRTHKREIPHWLSKHDFEKWLYMQNEGVGGRSGRRAQPMGAMGRQAPAAPPLWDGHQQASHTHNPRPGRRQFITDRRSGQVNVGRHGDGVAAGGEDEEFGQRVEGAPRDLQFDVGRGHSGVGAGFGRRLRRWGF